MKSFADWTQEIADTVGEVKHHWEEDPDAGAIAPQWQAPGAPILTNMCWGCSAHLPSVADAVGPNTGLHYQVCDSCCRSNGLVRPGGAAVAPSPPPTVLGCGSGLPSAKDPAEFPNTWGYRSLAFLSVGNCPYCSDSRFLYDSQLGAMCCDCIDRKWP